MPTRLNDIPGFSIDRVAAAAGEDPSVLRLENLDTDLRPPVEAVAATREAIERDEANSYLPFTGTEPLRTAAAAHVSRLSGVAYDPGRQCVITAGGTAGMFNALLAAVDPGDEVILTDPTYAGMIYRVRLAGAIPRLVPFAISGGEWRLDLDALRAAVTPRTRMLFLMNPSMPSGAVLTPAEWACVAELCAARELWLLYNAAMERILYDGRSYIHPAALPGMAERTITVGSVSKEYRMIGWRTGWVVGPESVMADVARVSIYNVVTPVGIAQPGAAAQEAVLVLSTAGTSVAVDRHLAAADSLSALLDAGADPDKPTATQMHNASMCCDPKANATPFYRAAVASDVEALRLLLNYDPDFTWVPEAIKTGPRQPGSTGGKTALMVAMDGGKGVGMAGGPGDIREGIAPPFREVSNRNPVDAVKLLLEAGVDPDAKTPDGDTALHLAAFAGKLDIVRTLVEGGADQNVKDAAGKTALQVVSEQKPRPPRPTAGALVDGEMPAQPSEVADLLRGLASGNTQASNAGSR